MCVGTAGVREETSGLQKGRGSWSSSADTLAHAATPSWLAGLLNPWQLFRESGRSQKNKYGNVSQGKKKKKT